MASAGHVVVLDAWDAGWEAYRDGQRVPLLEANVAFRAVEVPEGRHEIELRYRPRGLPAGLLLTFAAALVCVGTFATRARKAA